MPMGVKAPISSWADCQLAGMSDCGGVSSKHSTDGIGGVCHELTAAPGRALKLCAGVEKWIAPASEKSHHSSLLEGHECLRCGVQRNLGAILQRKVSHLRARSWFQRSGWAVSSLCS